MNLSGVLVIVPPEHLNEVVADLAALQGVDVHHTDPASGRVVVTLEGETVGDEVELLKRVKALAHVALAEMVYHHFEEAGGAPEEVPADLEEGLPAVPKFLND
jgi:nitrate reductase NapD